MNFEELREKYKYFYYNSFEITDGKNEVTLKFDFEIPNLAHFYPTISILKKNFKFKDVNSEQSKNMVFNIGMIELISYWKCACPKNVIIKCGYLNDEQISFWKKLYFNGLGELFYRNNIKTDIDNFMNIEINDESVLNEKANACDVKNSACDIKKLNNNLTENKISFDKLSQDNLTINHEIMDISNQKTENEKTNNEYTGVNCSENNEINSPSSGYIVPIGGGKDSVVTLETLPLNRKEDYCLIINPKPVTLKCAYLAGFENDNIIEINRKIDKNLIDLNSKGFINGHTPFSAMLAFTSYFVAYLLNKKYISLSNENSANESNVKGQNINHQYSKSFEFECDFENYADKYLRTQVKYFSFLRPLNELQIAKLFSKHEKYFKVFKSCNVGSKGKEWIWCCNCAKCLFAFTILSPYLYKEKIVDIFGEDLFDKKSLLDIFIELTGNGEYKPFDCVGTYEEVNYAITYVINKLEKEKMKLPYLLKYYKEHYKLADMSQDLTKRYNENNNLTKEQNDILKKAIFED